jgi:hypothetical protein
VHHLLVLLVTLHQCLQALQWQATPGAHHLQVCHIKA